MPSVSLTPIGPPLPEFECELIDASSVGDVERPLRFVERLANNDAVRRLVILIALGLIWELYARWIDNPLILPTFSATANVTAIMTSSATAVASSVTPNGPSGIPLICVPGPV